MAKVKTSQLLIFCNQFASMVRSNLPLISVMKNLAKETPQKALKEALTEILEQVERGVDFGDALKSRSDIFDSVFVHIVKAGMISGRLGESLTQISEYLARADEINRRVRGATSYPLFLLVAFFGVFNAMVFFILPRFKKMFESFGKELPQSTQILLAIGDFWASYWHLILLSIGALIVSFIAWLATPDGRYLWDKHKLSIPLVGSLWRMASLARFLRTFAVQLHNEVDLITALRLSASVSNNAYIMESLNTIADQVSRGVSISKAFHEYNVFSGIVLQMITAGEEAGTLDELLLSAADYFERLLDSQIQVVTGLINPVLTVVMGLGIAGMMVAAFMPVFHMTQGP